MSGEPWENVAEAPKLLNRTLWKPRGSQELRYILKSLLIYWVTVTTVEFYIQK